MNFWMDSLCAAEEDPNTKIVNALLSAIRNGNAEESKTAAEAIVVECTQRERGNNFNTIPLYSAMAEAMEIAADLRSIPLMRALFEACKEVRVFKLHEVLPKAVNNGATNVVQCFLEEFDSAEQRGSDGHYFAFCRKESLVAAAKVGNLEILKLIHHSISKKCLFNAFGSEAVSVAPPELRSQVKVILSLSSILYNSW